MKNLERLAERVLGDSKEYGLAILSGAVDSVKRSCGVPPPSMLISVWLSEKTGEIFKRIYPIETEKGSWEAASEKAVAETPALFLFSMFPTAIPKGMEKMSSHSAVEEILQEAPPSSPDQVGLLLIAECYFGTTVMYQLFDTQEPGCPAKGDPVVLPPSPGWYTYAAKMEALLLEAHPGETVN